MLSSNNSIPPHAKRGGASYREDYGSAASISGKEKRLVEERRAA
jgi:hypothetical protein